MEKVELKEFVCLVSISNPLLAVLEMIDPIKAGVLSLRRQATVNNLLVDVRPCNSGRAPAAYISFETTIIQEQLKAPNCQLLCLLFNNPGLVRLVLIAIDQEVPKRQMKWLNRSILFRRDVED
uniref:Uncharacterized protein n=1 Tax=Fusarium oxysporum (strain Fo5176) TaxID=660025 RepID=A0A0D2YIP3_FUSOF